MTVKDLLVLLKECPIIASVQADAGTPCDDPETICRLAQSSLNLGVRVLRMQGAANLRAGLGRFSAPIIGLIKRESAGSEVYITPTLAEVQTLLQLGCPVIALDGTARTRPGNACVVDLVAAIHAGGALAMADCDTMEAMEGAVLAGADLLSTTLSGYTAATPGGRGPDLGLVFAAAARFPIPVLAEGRFEQTWQVRAALRAGASGVVMGGALNDPIKQTRRFVEASREQGPVGAVDIGGTWLRFGTVDGQGRVTGSVRVPQPAQHSERLEMIRSWAGAAGVSRIGISAGGVIDPVTSVVLEAKSFIGDYVGQAFDLPGNEVFALNDGLATAWGHACHPCRVGSRTCTLALGTGVGMGVADGIRIETDSRGDYPRLNDQVTSTGASFEDLLGGLNLSMSPSSLSDRELARLALREAVAYLRRMIFPDHIVVCGGVGLLDWLRPAVLELGAAPSELGEHAGLIGAAYLALNPPADLF